MEGVFEEFGNDLFGLRIKFLILGFLVVRYRVKYKMWWWSLELGKMSREGLWELTSVGLWS